MKMSNKTKVSSFPTLFVLLSNEPCSDSHKCPPAGFLFGSNCVKQFNHTNHIDVIARAHQLVMEGYKYMFDKQLVTVWSALRSS